MFYRIYDLKDGQASRISKAKPATVIRKASLEIRRISAKNMQISEHSNENVQIEAGGSG